MTIKLLTEHYLEFLNLTGGSIGSSEATLVKIPHCWKSHVVAKIRLHHLQNTKVTLFFTFIHFLFTIIIAELYVQSAVFLLQQSSPTLKYTRQESCQKE